MSTYDTSRRLRTYDRLSEVADFHTTVAALAFTRAARHRHGGNHLLADSAEAGAFGHLTDARDLTATARDLLAASP